VLRVLSDHGETRSRGREFQNSQNVDAPHRLSLPGLFGFLAAPRITFPDVGVEGAVLRNPALLFDGSRGWGNVGDDAVRIIYFLDRRSSQVADARKNCSPLIETYWYTCL